VAEEHLLRGQRRDIEELRDEVLAIKNEEDLPRLLEELRGAYGRYVQWMMTSDRLSKRTVEPDVDIITERAVAGLDAAYDQILDAVGEGDFIEVRHLIDNFFRIRRYPVVAGRGDIEEALQELYRNREIGFKGLKQNYLPGRDSFPLGVHQGLSVARYETLKAWEPRGEEDEEPAGEGGDVIFRQPGDEGPSTGDGEARERGQAPEPQRMLQTLTLVGRTPLGLQEIGPDDEVHGVAIVVDERELPLDKEALAELIAGLPRGKAVRLQLKVVQRG